MERGLWCLTRAARADRTRKSEREMRAVTAMPLGSRLTGSGHTATATLALPANANANAITNPNGVADQDAGSDPAVAAHGVVATFAKF